MPFDIFTFQQWSGQNSISYYGPTILKAIGLSESSSGLLASGIYGIVKIVSIRWVSACSASLMHLCSASPSSLYLR